MQARACQYIYKQIFNTNSSNWTDYTESSSSQTESEAFSSGAPRTGNWEHHCQLSYDAQYVTSSLRAY